MLNRFHLMAVRHHSMNTIQKNERRRLITCVSRHRISRPLLDTRPLPITDWCASSDSTPRPNPLVHDGASDGCSPRPLPLPLFRENRGGDLVTTTDLAMAAAIRDSSSFSFSYTINCRASSSSSELESAVPGAAVDGSKYVGTSGTSIGGT